MDGHRVFKKRKKTLREFAVLAKNAKMGRKSKKGSIRFRPDAARKEHVLLQADEQHA